MKKYHLGAFCKRKTFEKQNIQLDKKKLDLFLLLTLLKNKRKNNSESKSVKKCCVFVQTIE